MKQLPPPESKPTHHGSKRKYHPQRSKHSHQQHHSKKTGPKQTHFPIHTRACHFDNYLEHRESKRMLHLLPSFICYSQKRLCKQYVTKPTGIVAKHAMIAEIKAFIEV